MIKRHCDLCDSVIRDFDTRYKLIKVKNKGVGCVWSPNMEEVTMEVCPKCLNKIIEAREQSDDNSQK